MKLHLRTVRLWTFTPFFLAWVVSGSEPGENVSLPPADDLAGKPLRQALRQRRTVREFQAAPLPDRLLSGLLWAGCGVNRPAEGRRTVPSAMNSQEIEIYVARHDKLFVYEPVDHRLKLVAQGDFRAKTTGQAFASEAPVVLIYVANLDKLSKAKPESRPLYAAIDTGCIVQNVYLYCAAENLGTVVYDLDRKTLAEVMGLNPNQQVILAQAVGFPRNVGQAQPLPLPGPPASGPR